MFSFVPLCLRVQIPYFIGQAIHIEPAKQRVASVIRQFFVPGLTIPYKYFQKGILSYATITWF
jgi:hypothetical protein